MYHYRGNKPILNTSFCTSFIINFTWNSESALPLTSDVWIAEWWAGWDDGHHTNLRLLTHLQPFPHLAHGFQWASTPPHVSIFTCVGNDGNFFCDCGVYWEMTLGGGQRIWEASYFHLINPVAMYIINISTLNFTMQLCHVILESLAMNRCAF